MNGACRCAVLAVFAVLAIPPAIAEEAAVLVRRVDGTVRAEGIPVSGGGQGEVRPLAAGDLLDSGQVVATGPDGFLVLRIHPERTILELPSSSRAALSFAPERAGAEAPREVELLAGHMRARVAGGSAPLTLATSRAVVRMERGRLAFSTGPGSATVVVLDGEARVTNRKTGAVDIVTAGGKAVADAHGTAVARASTRELAAAGTSQNILEVDFWNPATEEYRTLEIEYEGVSRPSRGP